ncbi:MAG: hypothetical protein QXF41_02530 [Candidatus Micrarchaeaceae archaeon]
MKLPYMVKEEHSLMPFIAVVGVAASICADLIQYSFLTFIAVQFFASMGIMVAVTWYLGPPAISARSMSLTYPRAGAMRFPKVKGSPNSGAKEVNMKNVHMFYVSLRDAHFMAQPIYEPVGSFMNSLVLSIEAQAPQFAWVQLIFERINITAALASMRYGLLHALDDNSTWTKMAPERVKAINAIISQPTVALAIRGVWVGEGLHELPFNRCADALDQLAVFTVRDPRLLVLMAERRTEFNLPFYFGRYFGSRTEAPAFVLAADSLPFFIHFPSMGTIKWGIHVDIPTISAWGSAPPASAGMSTMEVSGVPRLNRALEKDELARLAGLASQTPRSLEVLYYEGQTHILLSAVDMERYELALASVYGQLNLVQAPDILSELFQVTSHD